MKIEDVNPSKLIDEFIANGISIVNNSNNLEYENGVPRSHIGTLCVELEEGTDMELVQQIINTHDPTPLPPQPSKEELLEQRINELELFILTKEGLI